MSLYEDDPEEFMHQVMTQNETWVHHFDPVAKKQSMQWKYPGSHPPKIFKRVSSAGKVMASIFWDRQGIVMVDYFEEGRMKNGAYYAEELRRLRQGCEEKKRNVDWRCSALQDNAPAQTSQVTMALYSSSPVFSRFSSFGLSISKSEN